MKQHGEDFKALFAKQMEGAAERLQDSAFVQQATEAGIAAQQGDTSLLELLKKQESAREAATLRPQLEKLWADFDADGSGALTPDEVLEALKHTLTWCGLEPGQPDYIVLLLRVQLLRMMQQDLAYIDDRRGGGPAAFLYCG